MNLVVLSLTYLILLRVARIPLPPLVRARSGFSTEEAGFSVCLANQLENQVAQGFLVSLRRKSCQNSERSSEKRSIWTRQMGNSIGETHETPSNYQATCVAVTC